MIMHGWIVDPLSISSNTAANMVYPRYLKKENVALIMEINFIINQ